MANLTDFYLKIGSHLPSGSRLRAHHLLVPERGKRTMLPGHYRAYTMEMFGN